MKLTYWVATCKDDSDAYSIRRARKYQVLDELERRDAGSYEKPRKVTTPDAEGAFEVLEMCLSEGGAYWE